MKNKNDRIFLIVIAIALVLVIGFFIIATENEAVAPAAGTISEVVTVDAISGKQIINVDVKNGYSPRVINARAGTANILRLSSKNDYGCERAFTIPKLNIRKDLPATGDTDIEIPAQAAGTSLIGVCTMGMYSFTMNFN